MKSLNVQKKLAARRATYDTGPKGQHAGQGLMYHRPGSQNRRK